MTEQIQKKLVENELRDAYLDYAMSVITARALPDVHDGLKPVHRRILFSMHELGVQHNKQTKKSALEIKASLLEVVKNCPLDRMLIETDAPYLAPNLYRGKRCEPWMVEEVAKKIAEIKGLKPEEVVAETTKNAINLFQNIR